MIILSIGGGRIETTQIVLRIELECDRLHFFHLDPNGYERLKALYYKHGREKR